MRRLLSTSPRIAAAQAKLKGQASPMRLLLALIAGTILFGLGFLGAHTWQDGHELRTRAEANVQGLAHVIAEQTARTISSMDLTLLSLLDALHYNQIDWRFDTLHIHQYLREKQPQSGMLRNLFILDADGRLTNESVGFPPNDLYLADRPYFTVPRDDPGHGLFIGSPLTSRVTPDWMVGISRRIDRTNRGFDGIVGATIDLARLRAGFDEADLGAGMEIALFLENGTLLLRSPHDEAAMGQAILDAALRVQAENGEARFTTESPIDGVRRIYSLHRVPGAPVYVLAGMDESLLLASWHNEIAILSVVSLVIVGAMSALGILVLRTAVRRERLVSALRDSETRFRDFAEAASNRFWQSDAEHRLIWHSGSQGEIAPTYIGKTRWAHFNVDLERDPHWRQLKEDMDAHRPFRDFRYTRTRNGDARHRSVSGKPIFDTAGTFIGYRGIYSDITPQVTAQERAQRSRDRFLRSIENLSEGFALYDADDRLVVCNTRFQEIYAAAAGSLVRWSSFEDLLRDCIAHDLIPEARGHESEWTRHRLQQHRNLPYVQEVERNGRWMQIRERRDKEGGTMILALDIHDQKIAELHRLALARRLESLFDHMPAGCIVTDMNMRVTDWNPMAEQIFGYDKAEMLGADLRAFLIPANDRQEFADCVTRLTAGERMLTGRGRKTAKSGQQIDCEWVKTALVDESGRLIGIIMMVTDISEKRLAEEKLRQATRMEAIGQLTGGIAHDFNNLLQVIIGNSEILMEALAETPRLQRWATMIKEAAGRGADLTFRLLAYSRRQTLEPVSTDLNRVITEIRPLLQGTLGEATEIVTDLAPALWSTTLDRSQIDQALLNLVLNARDAMPTGGTLRIATSNAQLDLTETIDEARSGEFVQIVISDNGSGMAPHVIKRAFEPFFTTKDVGKGNGLGLSMVHGFVNQSGGLVQLESEIGKGTTVRIYFPRAESRAAAATSPKTYVGETRKTVLVVEDNDMVRTYVTAQLESLGYEVIEAENGPDGLAKLESAGHIDLLFTDVIMPGGMNGRELAERAIERRPRLKVLFTSGYDESAITTDGRLATGMFLLKKPYQRQDLANKIVEVLNSPSTVVA